MIRDYLPQEACLQPDDLAALQRCFERVKAELDLQSEDEKQHVAAAMVAAFMASKSAQLAEEAGRTAIHPK